MRYEIKEVWAPRLGVAVSIQPSPHLDPWDYGYVYIVNRYTFTDQVLDLSSHRFTWSRQPETPLRFRVLADPWTLEHGITFGNKLWPLKLTRPTINSSWEQINSFTPSILSGISSVFIFVCTIEKKDLEITSLWRIMARE